MLKKLTFPIFDYDRKLVRLKRNALCGQCCFVEHKPPNYEPYIDFIIKNYPKRISGPFTFYNVVRQMSEDVCIHCNDWLASAFVCFPSNWKPEEKIGKSFSQLHEPVPEKISKLPYKGNYERTVYGLGRSYNRNTRFPVEHRFLTRERQVLVGFGDSVLFIIRQYLEPITPEGLSKLPTDPTMRKYKGLPN